MTIDFTVEERSLIKATLSEWRKEVCKEPWAMSRIIDLYDAIIKKTDATGGVSFNDTEHSKATEVLMAVAKRDDQESALIAKGMLAKLQA